MLQMWCELGNPQDRLEMLLKIELLKLEELKLRPGTNQQDENKGFKVEKE